MIHQLLDLQRNLFVIDCESTGLDIAKDRIVELAFEQWDATGMVKEWQTLVNPGIPIPPSASKIHGITNAMVGCCRLCYELEPHVERYREGHGMVETEDDGKHEFHPYPSFKQLAANLAKGFTNCDFAGQNVRYDLRMLAAEFARAGVAWSYAGARIIDSSQLERLAVPRSLSHLHEKYVRKQCDKCDGSGKITVDAPTYLEKCPACNGLGTTGLKHDGAHGALSDVRAAATVIAKQLETHDALPRDLDKLHKMQWPNEWLDGDGKFQLIEGVATCQFGKHRGVALKNIPTDYLDWLIKSEFSPEIKALAANAKLGIYPEAK